MTTTTKVQVEGADTLVHTLGNLETDLTNLAPPQAGQVIQGQARVRAPFVTGRLRASITSEVEDGAVQVGSNLEYAGVVEYGWPGHHIKAQPFLRPAAEDTSVWGPVYEAGVHQAATKVRGA